MKPASAKPDKSQRQPLPKPPEQVAEVDTMTTLIQTIKHANGNMLWVEDFVRRTPALKTNK